MIFAKLYNSQHTREISGFRLSMRFKEFVFCRGITCEGHPIANLLRLPVGLVTNAAIEEQGPFYLVATETMLATLGSLTTLQSQICK